MQIINAVLKDPGDRTKLSLLFANQTEPDILCRTVCAAHCQPLRTP